MKTITVPKQLLWDYDTPPEDMLWRLQRIADFFPLFGTDRETVTALFVHKGELKIDTETQLQIEEFYKAWKLKDG